MKTTLRLLRKKDILPCSRIVGMNYSRKYQKDSRKEIESMFSNAAVRPVYWVAEALEEIVGFGGYIQSWMDYGIYQIFWVNVHPEFQRQGIGQKLVNKLVREITNKDTHMIQLTATKPNVVYYRRFGFKTLVKINDVPEYLMHLKIS